MATRRTTDETPRRGRRPATTPEEQEHRLIALAYDVAEEQLEKRTASSQLITTMIKAGSERERLERVRLEHETRFTQAKIDNMDAIVRSEQLLDKAMRYFKGYSGEASEEELRELED